jgi:hypothetical protein
LLSGVQISRIFLEWNPSISVYLQPEVDPLPQLDIFS